MHVGPALPNTRLRSIVVLTAAMPALRLPRFCQLRKTGPFAAGVMPMISLADLQRRIAQGELTPDAAIAQSLEAIGAQEKAIGAFVCYDAKVRAGSAGP